MNASEKESELIANSERVLNLSMVSLTIEAHLRDTLRDMRREVNDIREEFRARCAELSRAFDKSRQVASVRHVELLTEKIRQLDDQVFAIRVYLAASKR